eukprot:6200307-Pleurochrysis_carterae.AAC.2
MLIALCLEFAHSLWHQLPRARPCRAALERCFYMAFRERHRRILRIIRFLLPPWMHWTANPDCRGRFRSRCVPRLRLCPKRERCRNRK